MYTGLCIEERWQDWRRRMPHWFNDTLIRSNVPEDITHATQITEDVLVKSDDPYNSVIPDRNAHNSAKINSNARPQPHMTHQAHVTVVVVGIFRALTIFPRVVDMFPNWSIPSPVSASSFPMKFEQRLNEWLNMDRQQSYSQRKFFILSPAIVTLWLLSISKKKNV